LSTITCQQSLVFGHAVGERATEGFALASSAGGDGLLERFEELIVQLVYFFRGADLSCGVGDSQQYRLLNSFPNPIKEVESHSVTSLC
jgi:hypothetical protein